MSDPVAIHEYLQAFRQLHHCQVGYRETRHIVEVEEGRAVFDGDVHAFDVAGHPLAHRGYAWSYEAEPGKWRIVTELENLQTSRVMLRAAIDRDGLIGPRP